MDAPVDLRRVQFHIRRAEGDVLVYRLLKELILRVLEHQPHLKADLPDLLGLRPDILSLKEDLAGGGLQKAIQVLDQGGFA